VGALLRARQQWMEINMKTHIMIPAIASLALLAASPAFASTSMGNASQGAKIESTGAVFAALSPARARCRAYANYHARQHCYEINGLPWRGRHP
jgi:hypothetical protein